MNVAIAHWRGRISRVFDVAANVLVVEVSDGVGHAREDVALDEEDPQLRAARLAQTGTHIMICSAISCPVETKCSP